MVVQTRSNDQHVILNTPWAIGNNVINNLLLLEEELIDSLTNFANSKVVTLPCMSKTMPEYLEVVLTICNNLAITTFSIILLASC